MFFRKKLMLKDLKLLCKEIIFTHAIICNEYILQWKNVNYHTKHWFTASDATTTTPIIWIPSLLLWKECSKYQPPNQSQGKDQLYRDRLYIFSYKKSNYKSLIYINSLFWRFSVYGLMYHKNIEIKWKQRIFWNWKSHLQ